MNKFLVIGNPIDHSLSPKLHNYWFKKYKLTNFIYEKKKITERDIKYIINEIKRGSLSGLNVTVPFKKSVIPFCDKLDKTAEDLQSVNTISKKDGKVIGWNTDSLGFQECLDHFRKDNKGKSVFVLGAGGVTASILDALWGYNPKKVYISNRTKKKAEDLKNQFKEKFQKLELLDWGDKPPGKCDIVVNTTSIGLRSGEKINLDFSDYKSFGDKILFIDLIYNHKTNFLKDAEKRGNSILDGKTMFLGQAKYSFNIWTNILPTIDEDTIKLISND